MNTNKDLQVIYNYLINDVSNDEIRELIIYLKEYTLNGLSVDYSTSKEDTERLYNIMQLFNN